MSTKGEVLIEVAGLEKAFGDLKALDGVSTQIRQGEVVVVIGPSGSGKSTFLRSLNLLETPTAGTILFEGVDITDRKTDINQHPVSYTHLDVYKRQFIHSAWFIWSTPQ